MVVFNSARMKARDAKRVADLRQIAVALYMLADSQGGNFFLLGEVLNAWG